ncbi:hypothetical protein DFH09DRAFT_1311585 [Mycena vulgaris]|nr:hypothetical protein DFH09DRAFT_1311585 [Mycena vulgaris]
MCWLKEKGFQSDNGWKPQAWPHCIESLKDSPGPPKTADKIQDHWGNLKSNFNVVYALRGASGFGWDDGLKMVTATDEVWDTYLKTHSKAKRWRKTCFPLYDDILYLVDGIVAIGAGAFHAGASQPDDTLSQPPNAPPLQMLTRYVTAVPITIQTLIFVKTPPDDDLTPSLPVRPRRKRAASSSPPAEGSRKAKKRNAEAAAEIASALERVASSLVVVGSPQVRKQAMSLMEKDGDFVGRDLVKIMKLFAKDTAVAQIYVASSQQAMRTDFIRSLIDDE